MSTPRGEIEAYIKQQTERAHQLVIRALLIAGEKCTNEMRSYNGRAYKDQTGNLRSSTGYIVIDEGKVIKESTFASIKNGSNGSSKGQALAEQLSAQYTTGMVLVCVAGMEYAVYVQAKGYNVTDSAERESDKIVADLLKQFGLK
jgi:hypothetical protein